jgi:DNA-binding beta-propeller fold protein YncE
VGGARGEDQRQAPRAATRGRDTGALPRCHLTPSGTAPAREEGADHGSIGFEAHLIVGRASSAALAALGLDAGRPREGTPPRRRKPRAGAPGSRWTRFWPKPCPNHWILGSSVGVTVDARDHVFISIAGRSRSTSGPRSAWPRAPRRPRTAASPPRPSSSSIPPATSSATGAVPADGYEWPASNHGITSTTRATSGSAATQGNDAHVLKFTQGRQVPDAVRARGQEHGSNDTENFGQVAKIFVDPKANEAYVADGYANKRVAVIDADTGKFKRYWGAYGNKPDDTDLGKYDPEAPPAPQFRTPVHCAELAHDGLVYVCDRPNDRIQVFRKDGTFVKEAFIAKKTLGDGSVWDIAFSKDPQQRYLYLADGKNEKVYILDRDTLKILTSFGDGGRQPGQFFGVHSIATDSKGNIYTTETYEGKRLQKFVYKGLGPVTRPDQGAPWPGASRK